MYSRGTSARAGGGNGRGTKGIWCIARRRAKERYERDGAPGFRARRGRRAEAEWLIDAGADVLLSTGDMFSGKVCCVSGSGRGLHLV